MKVKLNIDETWEAAFSTKLEQDGPWSAWDLYKLAYEIEDQTLISEFEGLQSPKHLADLTPLPHQLETKPLATERRPALNCGDLRGDHAAPHDPTARVRTPSSDPHHSMTDDRAGVGV